MTQFPESVVIRDDTMREGLQIEVDTSAAGVQERVQERFDALVGELRSFFRRIEVPFLTLTPEREVIDQVLEQIGQAGRARR